MRMMSKTAFFPEDIPYFLKIRAQNNKKNEEVYYMTYPLPNLPPGGKE
jgi:hypothetical protein